MERHHQQQQDDQSCCVPPGFRFHPTEEELVGYYLARKVASQKIDLDIIQEVDLYRIEPWDLQERCGRQYSTGAGAGQDEDNFRSSSSSAEWYFFSFKDRKYPSGTRTNRATAAGFWKATGRDKPVLRGGRGAAVIGMRKTLVFYRGRAPNGRKTEWIMHEYRLQSSEHAPTPEEGWVVCRAFHKPLPNLQLQHRPPQLPFVFPGADHYAAAGPAGYYINDIDARLNGHGSGDLLHYLHPAAAAASNSGAGGGFVFPGNGSGHGQLIVSDDLVESKKHLNILSSSIPQLIESPATAAIDDDDQTIAGQQQAAAGAIDWNFLDSLLSSTSSQQLIHDSSSSHSQLMMHLQQQH